MSSLGRILILGSTGQVGRELQRSFAGSGELICPPRHQTDFTSSKALRSLVRSLRPDLILNAAAYTAVDRAESERDLAFAINADAPAVLAEEAKRLDILLVHYSTDYVFDGSKQEPWIETDNPNPLNIYGQSKRAGEEAIQTAGGKHLIFRTSWVYGPHGNNFLFTMLRLGRDHSQIRIVDDQIGAPTTSLELATATHAIVTGALTGKYGPCDRWTGLYHMTCTGFTTWYGFAQKIFARAARFYAPSNPEILPIASSEYPTLARRPANSVLKNEKLFTRFEILLPAWETALDNVFEAMRPKSMPANETSL